MQWIGFGLAAVTGAILGYLLLQARRRIRAAEQEARSIEEHSTQRLQAVEQSKTQVQQESQEVSALIDQLIENSPMGIAVLDASKNIVRANALAASMVPRVKDGGRVEIDGRSYDVTITPMDQGFLYVVRDRTEVAKEQQDRMRIEQAQRRASFLAEAAAALIPVADVPTLMERIRSLAVPRLAEAITPDLQLVAPKDPSLGEEFVRLARASIHNARALNESQLSVRARDALIEGALAQVRTRHSPINVQVQTLDKLLMKGDVPSYPTKLIGTPRRHTALLLKIVEDILESASKGSATMALQRGEVDLAELVLDVADGYKQHFAAASCPVEFKVVGPLKGRWDWLRMEQAISNLMTYAIQTGAGCPVRIVSQPEPERVRLTLHHYANDATAAGAAVALQMTRWIVEAHGGTMRVEDEGGVKRAIVVDLPRA